MPKSQFVSRMRKITPLLLLDLSFRRYWIGRSLSLLGGQISALAFPLTAVLVLKTSAVGLALLTGVGSMPTLLLASHVGAWVDRRGRRRQTMIAADLARAFVLSLIPAAALLGILTLPLLMTLWFMFGIASVFFRVSSSTLFVSLVPQDQYGAAQSLLQQAQSAGFLVGPALGGWFIQVLTAPIALLADALSFLASACSLALIHPREPGVAMQARPRVKEGFRFVRESAVLTSLFAATTTQSLFRSAFMAVYILYGTRDLGITPAAWGVILGPSSVLAIAGSALSGRIIQRMGLGPALFWGTVLFTVPLMVVPMLGRSHVLTIAVLFLVEGVSAGGAMVRAVASGTIEAAAVPNRVRARVAGAFSIASAGMNPFGALLAAVLAWCVGVHTTVWVATIGMAGSVLWLAVPAMLGLKRAQDLDPDGGVLSL